MFQPLHLGRRFFRTSHRKGASAAEEAWATDQLLPTERDLWLSMSDADRHHAVLVAQQVAATLGQQGTRPVLSAALLHEVGKTISGLSLYGRVIATLIITVGGRARAATWTRGFKRRVALYARHPDLGAPGSGSSADPGGSDQPQDCRGFRGRRGLRAGEPHFDTKDLFVIVAITALQRCARSDNG